MPSPVIHGHVDPAFTPVREAFAANFARGAEVGAGLTVYVDGKPVVNLWGGLADRTTGRPWVEDTPGVVFSSTKGLVATAYLMLEDRGRVDLDAPVATYWPEFAQNGKERITVRTLLNHRAGLSAVREKIRLDAFSDLDAVEPVLARATPLWEPGSAQGYGATAWGMYTGPLFRRIAGETVGTFLRREVFEPLHADVWLGMPPAVNDRVATLYPLTVPDILRVAAPKMITASTVEGRVYRALVFNKQSPTHLAFTNPTSGKGGLGRMNEPAMRALELPWMNAVATSDGLARVYAALARGGELDGVRLVSEAAIGRVARKQSWTNHDRVLHKPIGFAQGYAKDEAHLISPNEAAFGHTGAGGSVGFADPTHKLAVGYVMNRMDHHIRSPQALAICHAVYQVLQGG